MSYGVVDMKNLFLESLGPFRVRYLAALAVLFFSVNTAVRLVLHIAFPDALPFSAATLAGLVLGLVNDGATLFFVLLLPATLVLPPTDNFLKRPVGRYYAQAILFLCSFIFVFTAFAEYFFWDEFGSRFNFIAVDYLVYTTELLRNALESYPIPLLMLAVFLLSSAVTVCLWKWIRRGSPSGACSGPEHAPEPAHGSGSGGIRFLTVGGAYVAAVLVFVSFTPFSGNRDRYWNEYVKNGVYEMFSAYRNNQLDYRAFYKTMNRGEAFTLLQGEIVDAKPSFMPPEGDHLVRVTGTKAPETRPNVIVVIMESMGSKWLGEYAPNLNALAAEGLSFSNMMATGTRTVRGIEAVMLSIPPTPGNSIVRRPDNDRLFNLGTEFRRKGYDLKFIYGGIGFFDNMNPFFDGNGYAVVDKLDFARENKTFATAWGQCDEDLYAESLTRADASHASGTPFHQVLLTTSNHRPFTYPEGKVPIEPGTSRKGAVSYSDFAVGGFMREARTKPWFDDTVFVFVGDHPSSIAGKTELPADAYGIVCIMYGPRFFRPERVDTLCSQIDVAPTLLAALGWEYKSQFFGTNAREIPADKGRAWISTYQLLGMRTQDRLVVLSPDGRVAVERLDGMTDSGEGGEEVAARAVASYQCAYDLFSGGRLKETIVAAHMPRLQRSRDSAFAGPLQPRSAPL